MDAFEALFFATFSRKANGAFMDTVRTVFARKQWTMLVKAFHSVLTKVATRFDRERESVSASVTKPAIRKGWSDFRSLVSKFAAQVVQAEKSFAFNFVDGVLVKALKRGDWILLDEVRCVRGLLAGYPIPTHTPMLANFHCPDRTCCYELATKHVCVVCDA